jgi:hypothetical protein
MQRVREGVRDERLRSAADRNPDLRLLQNLVTRV